MGISDTAERFRDLSILPEDTGKPAAYFRDRKLRVSFSISHRQGRALAVVGPAQISLGCDLEISEPHSAAFLESFFTPDEIQSVEQAQEFDFPGLECVLWSAKESVLKILGLGLRVDTRCVTVSLDTSHLDCVDWQPFHAALVDGRRFSGWWDHDRTWLRTVACSAETLAPVKMAVARPANHS